MNKTAKLFLSEEDIEALNHVVFDYEAVLKLNEALEKHHKAVYNQQTEQFLAEQYRKILDATTSELRSELMWEVVNWERTYKSPYSKINVNGGIE